MTPPLAIAGKLLTVDLTSSEISTTFTQPVSDQFLGGLGVSTHRLLAGMPRGTGPFDDACMLAFGAGALVGTLAPTSSRISVNSLNAYSNGFGSASAGGAFAPELKFAGYDNLFVLGKARKPVYLVIDDDKVAVEDANFLWGRTVGETVDLIQARHNDSAIQVLAIGPAGERMLKAASVIVSRHRAAARCGLGAVMGAKNLKAVVVRGTGGIQVHDSKGFMEACGAITRKMRKTNTARKLRRYGTPVSFTKWNAQAAIPVRNFQRTHMDPVRAERLSCDTLKTNHIRKVFACYACPTPCSQYQEVVEGPYAGTRGEKIECQNIWDFGAKLDVDSLPAVLKASRLCTEYGLDISSASGVISWAFECYQKGLLTKADTGGLDLDWGNHGAVVELLRRIAHQEGPLGELLGKGVCEAAHALGKGSERFALHVKEQELAEELRPNKGWALGIAVDERAGTHTGGAPLTERMDLDAETSRSLFGIETAGNPDTYEGKAELVAYYQRFHAAMEGIGVCFFASNWMGPLMPGPEDFVQLYNLATGRNFNLAEFMMAGERIHTLQKLVNVKFARLTRGDDYPQARFFEEPASGAREGETLDHEKWSRMLDEYYQVHGWDPATTLPTAETLRDLGLSEFAFEVER